MFWRLTVIETVAAMIPSSTVNSWENDVERFFLPLRVPPVDNKVFRFKLAFTNLVNLVSSFSSFNGKTFPGNNYK